MSFNVEVKDKCIVITELQTANANDFPIIWLCENCQCKECFDAQTSCRKIDWKLFNPHQIPVHVAVNLQNFNFIDLEMCKSKRV